MKGFLQLFRAERIKWRRNWALALSIIIPLSQAAFFFLFYFFLEDRADPKGPGFPAWYEINASAWNLFFMPATVALVCALSWDIEAMAGRGRHLFVQPFARMVHFLVKLAGHQFLLVVATVLFSAFLVVDGLLLRRHVPTLAMGDIHLSVFMRMAWISLLASMPIVALHTWLSSRYRGLLVTLSITLGGTWGTLQLSTSRLLVAFSPWGMTTMTSKESGVNPSLLGLAAFMSIVLTVVICVFGTLDFHHRKETFEE